MIITFSFDSKSKYWESNSFADNWFFLQGAFLDLLDQYESKGYLYQSTVYEAFGLVWDPSQDNKCLTLEKDGKLMLLHSNDPLSNKIDIIIGRDCKELLKKKFVEFRKRRLSR